MPAPFQVRDADRPGEDLGQWDEGGNIRIPGTLTAGGITGPAGEVVFSALVAAFVMVASTDLVLSAEVAGDAAPRFSIDAAGKLSWGPGSGAADISINRYAVGGLEVSGALRFTNGQLLFRSDGSVNVYSSATDVLRTDDNLSVGGGLQVAEGSNLTMGVATLVAGTVTVNNTRVTANSRFFLTVNTPGGTVGSPRISAKSAGVSFTITSSQGADTSTVAWLLVEPTT